MNKILKGDNVQIMLGKDRGKTGEVERVIAKEGKLYVANLNIFKRHVKGRQGIEGGIIDLIKPMDVSNVQLVCPNCKKPTRIGFRTEANNKIRMCKKCGKDIK